MDPKNRDISGSDCNCRAFDSVHLVRVIQQLEMTELFKNTISGFADTLPAFEDTLPGMPNFQQNTIVQHVLGTEYVAHNAVNDANILQRVTQSSKTTVSESLFGKHSFSLSAILQKK